MLNIGDTVKVIAATEDASYCDGRKKEYIPIGTICTVKEIGHCKMKIRIMLFYPLISMMDYIFAT